MIIVERMRYNNDGTLPNTKIVYIASDVEDAHKAKELLECKNSSDKIGYRVLEIDVPTSIDELLEDLK